MSDHYQAMVDMRSDINHATLDQLRACVLELLGQPEINQNVHMLAVIGRHTDVRTRASRRTPGNFPYSQFPHRYAGSDTERQGRGDPGHCEDCVSVGHVEAHPDLGCGDVGCTADHQTPARNRHDYEPGDTTHPMKSDPDCRVCGGTRHD